MVNEITKVTVLTAYSDSVPMKVEIFALWHGGEHRVNDIIVEWGDVDNWKVEREPSEDKVTATNDSLGSEIVLRCLEVQSGGEENHGNKAIPI